ncbi:beta strand repeat-containing protein, partial [Psychrobacter sanguinis]
EVAIDTNGDGTPDYTVTADASGNYSVDTSAAPLTNGETVSATATDEDGTSEPGTSEAPNLNEAPILTGDFQAEVVENYSTIITTTDLDFTDPDAEDIASEVTFTVTDLTNGVLMVDGTAATSFTGQQLADGQVSFAHDGSNVTDANNQASFSVIVEDGNEDVSAPVPQEFTVNIVPLAEITNITVTDNVNAGIELPGTLPNTATNISGVASLNYGDDYVYSGGIVADSDNASPSQQELTNDTTPTMTVTIDNLLVSGYQTLQIIRTTFVTNQVIDDQGNITEVNEVSGVQTVFESTDSTLTSFDYTETALPETYGTTYQYEARIVNIDDETSITTTEVDTRLDSTEATSFELDTIEEALLVSDVVQGGTTQNPVLTISGVNAEQGTVVAYSYTNVSGEYVFNPTGGPDGNGIITSEPVDADGNWSLTLTGDDARAYLAINDVDNYVGLDETNATPRTDSNGNEVYDEFLPLGFVDQAGNATDPNNPIKLYYFDYYLGEGGIDIDLNPLDRPRGAENTLSDGTAQFTTNFDDDRQIIYVAGEIGTIGVGASNNFTINLAGGDDVLNVEGDLNANVIVNMGTGNDSYVGDGLVGVGSATQVNLGAGDNQILTLDNDGLAISTIAITAEGDGNNLIDINSDSVNSINASTITFTNGDDTILTRGGIANSTVRLGNGVNQILVGNDIDDSFIYTGDNNDVVVITNTSSTAGSLQNTTLNLGNGDNTVSVNNNVRSGSFITTGTGNDTLTVGDAILNATINLGDGTNIITVEVGITNNADIDTGSGVDTITVGGNVLDSANISTGAEADTVNIAGGMSNAAQILTGTGNDTVTIEGVLAGQNSRIDLGEGDDTLVVGGNLSDQPTILAGSGNDTLTFNGAILSTVDNIDLGAGDDVMNAAARMDGRVDGGVGNDTFNITGSGESISLDDLINIENINLNGFGRILNDVNRDALTNDLFIQGDSSDRVNIGRQNLTGTNTSETSANGGGTWSDTGDFAQDGVTYDVWTNSNGNGNDYTVYIEQGINVI